MTDFLKKAKSQGHKAIAFTEHGTVRQLTNLHKEAEDIGIRPIYGVELYMCEDMRRKGISPEEKDELFKRTAPGERREAIYQYERDQGILERYHLTVLAKDQEGLRNLMRITSLGWIQGFYKRPRVDMATIEANSKGLIVLSGCQSGSIGGELVNEHHDRNIKAALAKVERLQGIFGEDFYGEQMPHNMPEQATVNQAVRMISHRFGMKQIATQDAHYIEPDDWKYQEAMLCINTRTNLADPQRFKFSTNDFWLKSRNDMEDAFTSWHGYFNTTEIKQMLDSTMEVAEKCQAKIDIDPFAAVVPPVAIPPEFNGDEAKYLRHLCVQGWKSRGLDQQIRDEAHRRGISEQEARKVYGARLELELAAIQRQKCVRYFLVVHEMYRWVRAEQIEVGPGRGSSGGCLAAYLLGITDIDPIRFNLLFERFLSPSRIDMPDFDCDFEDLRREEVIGYLRNQYGADHAAQIAANGKLTGKSCVHSIARILSIPLSEVQPVVDSIITRSSGDERASMTIEDSFQQFDVCRRFAARHPEVLEYAQKLEGQVKSLGKHAAGVVVSPGPLIDMCPLELRGDTIVTAVDMYGVADLGLMKLDILGIRNLSAMRLCREAIQRRHNILVDWLKIPYDDKATLDNFTKHNFTGIFQMDTTSADKICDGVEFTHFDDISAMIALDRPGTARSGLATEYLKRKKNPKAIKSIHPIVDEICKDTLGVIVYQEHVQRIFTDVAGFSPATADSLRRKIAKKYGDEAIAKERIGFVDGAMARGFTKELADKLISQITFFGCISATYGILTPLGERRICDLKPGDEVFSVQNGKMITNRIKAVGSSGNKLTYRIRFRSGLEVRASGAHWWMDIHGSWKKTLDLRPGEELQLADADATQTNRIQADRDIQEQTVLGGQGCRGSLEGRASPHHGATPRSRVVVDRAGSSQERQWLGQRPVQFGTDGPRQAHDGAQEAIQRAALLSGRLSEARIQLRHVSGALPGGVQSAQSCAGPAGRIPDQQRVDPGHAQRRDVVASVETWGVEDVWDMEMESEPANYVVHGGLISHNSYGFNKSHSVAYGMIAYREMWLKTYYPIEFMWGLLATEPASEEVVKLVRATRKMGIDVRPPDINAADPNNWSITDDNAIVGALSNIKGVGPAAVVAIGAAQPFIDFVDFCKRIDRRRVHKGVVTALIRAGAMSSLVPNPRWLSENIEAVWIEVVKRKAGWEDWLRRILSLSKAAPQWTDEEAQRVSSEINPLASGADPLEVFTPLIETMREDWIPLDAEDIWARGAGFIWGRIIETRYNQVGDFHSGVAPDEDEKQRMGWGRRYANLNIEDRSGRNQRVKVDVDIFDAYRHIVDKGNTVVACQVSIGRGNFKSMRASYLVDLFDLQTKLAEEQPLTSLELALYSGWYPGGQWAKPTLQAGQLKVTALVVRVMAKFDKKGNEMAFIGLHCSDGKYREALCFASAWPEFSDRIHQGTVAKFTLHKDKSALILDNEIRGAMTLLSV